MVDGKVVYADTQFFTETFDFVYVKLVGHSVSDDSGQKSALNNLLLVWKGNLKLLIVIWLQFASSALWIRTRSRGFVDYWIVISLQ